MIMIDDHWEVLYREHLLLQVVCETNGAPHTITVELQPRTSCGPQILACVHA